uniref:Non-specific serine/threonine protein kinase n=1 Tax=Steinernema glaseri TaxID=37863 RepID=A0A1I7YQA6_9BILA
MRYRMQPCFPIERSVPPKAQRSMASELQENTLCVRTQHSVDMLLARRRQICKTEDKQYLRIPLGRQQCALADNSPHVRCPGMDAVQRRKSSTLGRLIGKDVVLLGLLPRRRSHGCFDKSSGDNDEDDDDHFIDGYPLGLLSSTPSGLTLLTRRGASSATIGRFPTPAFDNSRRRPSLPVLSSIPEGVLGRKNSGGEMSSCGRSRSRRPSLADFSSAMKRYQSMEFDHKMESPASAQNSVTVEIVNDDDVPIYPGELVPVVAGMRLADSIEPHLRSHGISPDSVEFGLRNSKTPLPENSDVRYLLGHTVLIRSRRGAIMRSRSRAPTSVDLAEQQQQSAADQASTGKMHQRKMSADSVSRKSSFANAKVSENATKSFSAPHYSIAGVPATAPPPLMELVLNRRKVATAGRISTRLSWLETAARKFGVYYKSFDIASVADSRKVTLILFAVRVRQANREVLLLSRCPRADSTPRARRLRPPRRTAETVVARARTRPASHRRPSACLPTTVSRRAATISRSRPPMAPTRVERAGPARRRQPESASSSARRRPKC